MPASINGRLLQLSTEYYIKHGTPEAIKIDLSVNSVKKKLENYFGSKIVRIDEFGSYKRDTILPRKYDEHSDIDLLIFFNHVAIDVLPGAYRNQLVEFANRSYSRSEVYKDAPSVILELDHIKYDLVPAYEQSISTIHIKSIFIPQSDALWMRTDPNGFNIELTKLNTLHNSNIKKVIRLLKAWNAKVDYPIPSFLLEQEILRIWFTNCVSLEDYFFAAINGLSGNRNGNIVASTKTQALKNNAGRIKGYLQVNNLLGATVWLSHILPI